MELWFFQQTLVPLGPGVNLGQFRMEEHVPTWIGWRLSGAGDALHSVFPCRPCNPECNSTSTQNNHVLREWEVVWDNLAA